MSDLLKRPYFSPTIESIEAVKLPMTDVIRTSGGSNLGEEDFM